MVHSILVEANLHLAVKLQPDLIIRAILKVASILKKGIKFEIGPKILLRATFYNSTRVKF